MFSKESHEISNLQEYVKKIENITEDGVKFFFRGQAFHQKHKLLPSLLRVNDRGDRIFEKECEEQFLNKYKSRAIPYLDSSPNNDWEWLFLMQHYCTPTRLLDWTESPLVALYFAIQEAHLYDYSDHDSPVVWCLNPLELNKNVKEIPQSNDIPNINSKEIRMTSIEKNYGVGEYREVEYPVAIVGPFNSVRISAQRGVFTLFGHNSSAIENLSSANDFLDKIIIKSEDIEKIKIQLFKMGVTNSTIFPELESISKDVQLEYHMEREGRIW